ncbi:MAG: Hpt domain-containing protein [Hyphomicrobiaceae bacterium]
MASDATIEKAAGVSCPSVRPGGRGFAARRQAATIPGRQQGLPIDHAHLDRYTLGNLELEREVLALFAGEAPRTLERIREAAAAQPPCAQAWQAACHTLKGSARAVGAWPLAEAAEAAERQTAPGVEEAEAPLRAIEAALAEVLAHIAAY